MTDEGLPLVTGQLDISLIVECPHCEGMHDLFDDDRLTDDGYIYKQLLEGENFGVSDEPLETKCPHCGERFQVEVPNW